MHLLDKTKMRNQMNQNKKTVLMALSGGVDSSVAALILKNKGYNVIAAFMKNFSDTKDPLTGQCAWKSEQNMAIKIAYLLNIQLVTLDFEREYKTQVIEPMFKAYKNGKTPNPDISCNTIIKFPLLWKAAKKIGADYIATGHYAKIKNDSSGFHLLAAKDKEKDQSYFLAELSEEDLSHTLFPLGNYTKNEVRQIAKENRFPNWDKHGTAGICFIGNANFQEFLRHKIKEIPGKVLTPQGDQIGTHKGLAYYTIGQKALPSEGINITKPANQAQKRFYVAEKKHQNVLIVAPEGHPALKRKEVILRSLHLINKKTKISKSLKARIRHRGKFHPGILKKQNKTWKFIFTKPIEALAEGQYLALYSKQEVVGCGEMALI